MTRFLDSVLQDLRYAVRTFRNAPVFVLVAVVSLGLGIGANTAIFSLLNSTLLKALPVKAPEHLVRLNEGQQTTSWTNPIWEQIRDRQEALEGVFAYGTARLDLAAGGETRFVRGILASGSFFQVLGVPALFGRTFSAADDRRGCAGGPAVLSYRFWQSNYGGNEQVLGQVVQLDGHAFNVIGVTPPSFFGLEVGDSFDVALPVCSEAILRGNDSGLDRRSYWWLTVMGRLKADSPIEQAQASLRALQPSVREATLPPNWPPEYLREYLQEPFTLVSSSTGTSFLRTYKQALYVLMAVVAIVLLVACANIANLLLARAAARSREIAVRNSLGASRLRLVRQLLIESLLLGISGAVAGFVVAHWVGRLLVYQLSTGTRQVILDLALDGRVLGFTAAAGILTGILFGIVPALRMTRRSPAQTLREGPRGSAPARKAGAGRWLVGVQVALSLMLLFGASLFIRTYANLEALKPGFDRSNTWVIGADLRRAVSAPEQRMPLFSRMLEAIRTVPGVRSAAMSVLTPISGSTWTHTIQVDGYRPASERDSGAHYNYVSPAYFETLETQLVAGRDFTVGDTATSAKVAVVNETFARKFFGGRNPIGLSYRRREENKGWMPIEIVGIVRDAKYRRLREDVPATAYCPVTQLARINPDISFSVRGAGDLANLRWAIVRSVGEINADVALTFRSLESQVHDSLVQERLLATLSALFGVLALTLAAVGLAGLVSYAVTRRRAEIGIRAALGATRGSLVRLALGEVGLLTFAGLLAGAAGSLVAGRFAATLLYGLTPADPLTLVIAATLMALVSVVAAYIPARRAAQIDPVDCLRSE